MATPQEGQLLSIMMAEPAWTLLPVKREQRGLSRAWATTDQSQCTLDRLAHTFSGRGWGEPIGMLPLIIPSDAVLNIEFSVQRVH